MNAAVRQSIALSLAVAIGLSVYLALLASPVLRDMPILFYRGAVLAAVAGGFAAFVGVLIGRRMGIPLLALPAGVVTAALALCFLVLFPVTIDRSVSVYLLATIDAQQADGIDRNALEAAFVKGYVRDLHAIDRRIAEQRASGNLVVAADGRLHLTAQGLRFVALSRRAAAWFGTDPHFVAGRTKIGKNQR